MRKKQRILNILVSSMLIVCMTIGNVLLLGIDLVTYALDNFEEQRTIIKNTDIEFDAFFMSEVKNTHYFESNVNELGALTIYLNVKSGYLKNGEIEFITSEENKELNYTLTGQIDSKDVIQEFVGDKLVLRQINSEKEKSVVIPIKYNDSENIDLSNINQNNKVRLKGIYVGNDGKEVYVEKDINLNIKWNSNYEPTIEQELIRYIGFNGEDGPSVLVQEEIRLGLNIEEGQIKLPISKTSLEVKAPEINGVLPKSVSILPKILKNTSGMDEETIVFNEQDLEYDKENNIIKLDIENNQVDDKVYSGIGQDIFVATYIYDATEILLLAEDSKQIGYEVKSIVKANTKLYEKEELLEKISEKDYMLEEQFGELVSYSVENITKNLLKGRIYENILSGEARNSLDYSIKTKIDIAEPNQVSNLKIQTINDSFIGEEIKRPINSTYKQTSISKNNFEKMLGEEGHVLIMNSNGETLGLITNETQEDENGNYIVNYEGACGEIIIETSRPISIGEIVFTHIKTILPEQGYNKDQIKSFLNIESEIRGSVKYSNTDNYLEISTKSSNIILEETITNAQISISKDSISSIVNNENIEITIKLNDDKENSDLYANPVFDILIPETIETINIKNTNILYNEGLSIKEVLTYTENGRTFLRIILEGESQEYSLGTITQGTNIVIVADIKIKNLTPDKTEKFEMFYTNPNAIDYAASDGDKGYDSIEFDVVAPKGVVTISTISGFDETGRELTSVKQGEKIEKIDILQPSKRLTMRLTLLNNNDLPIQDLSILGRIPFKNNKNVETDEDLGTTVDTILKSYIMPLNIKSSLMDIYYSSNGEATDDLNDPNNGWDDQPMDLSIIKSYMIIFRDFNMQRGEIIEFTYDFEQPENLEHNHYIFGTFSAKYNNVENEGLRLAISTPDKVGLTTGVAPELDIKLESTPGNGAILDARQVIKYKITVENVGNIVAQNVVVKSTVPEWGIYTEYLQEDIKNGIVEGYSNKPQVKEFSATINSLEVGEKREFEFELAILLVTSEDRSITNIATLTAKDMEMEKISNEVTHTVKEMPFSVNFSGDYGKNYKLKEDVKICYYVSVSNVTDKDKTNVEIRAKIPEGLTYVRTYKLEYNSQTDDYKEVDLNATYDSSTRYTSYTIPTLEKLSTVIYRIEVLTAYMEGDETLKQVDTRVSVKSNETEEVYSDDVSNTIARAKLSIVQTSNPTNQYIKEGDNLDYIINIKNEGSINATGIKLVDIVPDELQILKISYKIGETVRSISVPKDDNTIEGTIAVIEPGQTAEVTIETRARKLADGEKEANINNKATITAENIGTIETNNVLKTIEINPSYDPNNPPPPTTEPKKYRISGLAWIDGNENGIRESTEKYLGGIPVRLINAKNNNSIANSTTDSNGAYVFSNLETGNYIILFDYNSSMYKATEYRKVGVAEDVNSDAMSTNITENGASRTVGLTDTIKITDTSISNIDIGLIQKEYFNLSLDKTITSLVLQNNAGNKTLNYDGTKLAKIEIQSQNIASSTVIIEYEITIKNEGTVAGYAKNIVDYIPKDLKFSSELNPNWYAGEDGNLYTKQLADTLINPGESAKVKLILTKKMTENNLGLVNNIAEIYEDYNDKGLPDINSTPGNNAQGEDDISNADTLISVGTGGAIWHLLIITLAISAFGVGIYFINKRVLKFGVK